MVASASGLFARFMNFTFAKLAKSFSRIDRPLFLIFLLFLFLPRLSRSQRTLVCRSIPVSKKIDPPRITMERAAAASHHLGGGRVISVCTHFPLSAGPARLPACRENKERGRGTDPGYSVYRGHEMCFRSLHPCATGWKRRPDQPKFKPFSPGLPLSPPLSPSLLQTELQLRNIVEEPNANVGHNVFEWEVYLILCRDLDL